MSKSSQKDITNRTSKSDLLKGGSDNSLNIDPSINLDHSHLINRKFADISLSFGTETINVHKYFIDIRCKKLFDITHAKKQKKGQVIYDVKDIEYNVAKHVIDYIYYDSFDPMISETECVKLIKFAENLGLEHLAQMTEKFFQSTLNVGNLFDLLKLSHDTDCQRAKKLCLEFAVLNHSQFITDPRVRDIPITLFQEEAVLHEQLKQKISEGWKPETVVVTETSTFYNDLKNLYDTMEGADASIIINGTTIKFHRAIVALSSPKLFELMDQKEPIKLPKDFGKVTVSTFKAYLAYVYFKGIDFPPVVASELLPFAKQLDNERLVDICESKIRNGINNNTVLKVLELSFNPILKDKDELRKVIRSKCKRYFLENIKEIDVSPLRTMSSPVVVDLLIYIQNQLGDKWNIEFNNDEDILDQSFTEYDDLIQNASEGNTDKSESVDDVEKEESESKLKRADSIKRKNSEGKIKQKLQKKPSKKPKPELKGDIKKGKADENAKEKGKKAK